MQLKLCVYQYLMAARLMSHQSGSRVRMHMADLTPRLGNHTTSRLKEIPKIPREQTDIETSHQLIPSTPPNKKQGCGMVNRIRIHFTPWFRIKERKIEK